MNLIYNTTSLLTQSAWKITEMDKVKPEQRLLTNKFFLLKMIIAYVTTKLIRKNRIIIQKDINQEQI